MNGMRVGIDVSQLAYGQTGVANYLYHLVRSMAEKGKSDEFVLFFSTLRGRLSKEYETLEQLENVTFKKFPFPPKLLDVLWNKWHIMPIESLIGDLDVFISSDWTEPPAKRAKKATIIYDLIVHKYPEETDSMISSVQKRKLSWVKKESDVVFAISESTKKDIIDILKLPDEKISVLYPGMIL